ncbi:MAG: polyisoprenoid-binding protein [Nevskia sp.]|nr:polyisoprenoid-binding protein [Nevskia sp.]
MKKTFALVTTALALAAISSAQAEPVTYRIDPLHTFVSFAAPHIAGISTWRGKFDRTQSGTIVLDRAAKTGRVDIVIDTSSIDFGLEKLNEHAKSAELFDVAKYPTATYKAERIEFDGDTPVAVDGELSLHGVTRPVPLKIEHFKCIQDPFLKVERCGADASAVLDRSAFGIDYAVKMVGSPEVRLEIQVEALRAAAAGSS